MSLPCVSSSITPTLVACVVHERSSAAKHGAVNHDCCTLAGRRFSVQKRSGCLFGWQLDTPSSPRVMDMFEIGGETGVPPESLQVHIPQERCMDSWYVGSLRRDDLFIRFQDQRTNGADELHSIANQRRLVSPPSYKQ